jgi:hypothetical protein
MVLEVKFTSDIRRLFIIIFFTAVGLTPNSTENTENEAYIIKRKKNWEVQVVPHLYNLYPDIYLTTEEKAWKNLS